MLTTLLTVALLHWFVLVTPGPNVLVVSQLAADGHRKAACFAALGVTLVAVAWSLLAILGVNAVFAAHPRLRLALQIAGGVYLCYVAVRLWRARASTGKTLSSSVAPTAAFRLGFFTNIMNPKSALFFGSVFATALPPQPSTALLVAVVTMVLVNAFCWHMFLAFAFSHHRIQAVYATQRKVLNRVAGALVGAFGLRLIVTTVGELRVR
jgi:threonine efflux protein